MTALVLVRHGQASFGARNYDQLSALGIRQSRCLGEHWCRVEPQFDAAYCGLLERQLHTAQHAFACLPQPRQVVQHAAFDEYDHATLIRSFLPVIARDHPGMTLDRRELFADPQIFQSFFEKVVACWLSGREGELPLKESWPAFSERVLAGLRAIAPPTAKSVVAFTSGGVIAAALQAALGLEPQRAFEMNWRIYNASVHTFHLGRRGLALLGFNSVGHLEVQKDPALFTFR